MMTSLSLVNVPCTITALTPLFPRPQSSRLRAEGHCLQNGSTFCELFTSAQPSQVGQARGGTPVLHTHPERLSPDLLVL